MIENLLPHLKWDQLWAATLETLYMTALSGVATFALGLLLGLALLLSLVGNVLALFGPKLSAEAINALSAGAGKVDFPTVFYYAGWMAGCYVLSAVFTYLLNAVMIRMSKKIAKQMRHDIFESLSAMPVSFFDRYQTGNIISVVTYDVDTVNQSMSADLLQILQSLQAEPLILSVDLVVTQHSLEREHVLSLQRLQAQIVDGFQLGLGNLLGCQSGRLLDHARGSALKLSTISRFIHALSSSLIDVY